MESSGVAREFCPRFLSGSVTGVLMPRNTGCAYRFHIDGVPLRWCCCERLTTFAGSTLVPPALLVLIVASQSPTRKLLARSDRLLLWCCIVHRRPLGQAIAARCLVHSYQHASDISAGQPGRLSIHSAGSLRDACATCGYHSGVTGAAQQQEGIVVSRQESKTAGQHVKISR